MVEDWRLLEFISSDSYMNMAVEEAIARTVGRAEAPNTLRFWRNPNTIVIGRFQSAEAEVRFDSCKRYGTIFVRRFTGGGAVYQDAGNLNFSIFGRKRCTGLADLSKVFEYYSAAIIRCFHNIGLNAEFKPVNKIVIGKRKVSGIAGSLKWNCLTVHGSVLVKTNINVLKDVLKVVKDPVTTLQNELGREISIPEIKREFKTWFGKIHRVRLVMDQLMEEEKRLAKTLFSEKYSQEDWNYGSGILS